MLPVWSVSGRVYVANLDKTLSINIGVLHHISYMCFVYHTYAPKWNTPLKTQNQLYCYWTVSVFKTDEVTWIHLVTDGKFYWNILTMFRWHLGDTFCNFLADEREAFLFRTTELPMKAHHFSRKRMHVIYRKPFSCRAWTPGSPAPLEGASSMSNGWHGPWVSTGMLSLRTSSIPSPLVSTLARGLISRQWDTDFLCCCSYGVSGPSR